MQTTSRESIKYLSLLLFEFCEKVNAKKSKLRNQPLKYILLFLITIMYCLYVCVEKIFQKNVLKRNLFDHVFLLFFHLYKISFMHI